MYVVRGTPDVSSLCCGFWPAKYINYIHLVCCMS